MSWNRIEGNWKNFQGQLKEQWGKLTDDDLTIIKGKKDQLIGKLQERYGYAHERIKDEVNRFEQKYGQEPRA